MTERIVRPAPAHLCGRLVFICEDLWGAAASARRRLFKPGLGIVRARAGAACGPSNTPIKPVPIINTEAIVRAWTRSALLHCLSLFLFVLGLNLATTASAALPGPLGADRSQRRKTGRQRATEAIARPGHPDAGKRQDAHGTAEPPEAIARRHQAGYADSPGRHPRLHSRSRRKPGETARRPQQPGGALEHAVPAGADRDHNRPPRLARMAVADPGLPDRHGDLGGPGAGPALDHPTPGTPPRGSQYSAQPVAAQAAAVDGGGAAGALGHRVRDHAVPVRRHARFRGTARRAGAGLCAAGRRAVLVAVADLSDAAGRPAPHPGAGHPAPARAAAAVADRQPGRAGRFAARSGNHERVRARRLAIRGPAGQRDGGAPERAVRAALSPPHHPPDPQPAARAPRHAPRPAGAAAADRTTVVRAVPAAGGHLAGQHGGGRRRQRPGHAPGLLCALVAIVGMAVGGVIRRAYARGGRDGNRRMAYRGSSGISATPCSTSPTCCCSWKSACACWACRWPA